MNQASQLIFERMDYSGYTSDNDFMTFFRFNSLGVVLGIGTKEAPNILLVPVAYDRVTHVIRMNEYNLATQTLNLQSKHEIYL